RGTTSECPSPRRQIREQRQLQRLIRCEELVIDAGGAELLFITVDEPADRLEIVIAHDHRNGHHFGSRLHVFETRRSLEWKGQFVWIEQMKNNHVGAAEPEVFEA